MKEEFLDIVDANDTVIGSESISKIYELGLLGQTRGVKLFIVNDNKELLIGKRSEKKIRDAGLLDSPMTGHVLSGETYHQALIREAQEELNLDLSKYDYCSRGKLSVTDGLFSFIETYQMTLNVIPDFNKDDFETMFWIKPIDLITQMSQGIQGRKTLPVF